MATKQTRKLVALKDDEKDQSPENVNRLHVFYSVRAMTFVNWIAPPTGFDMSGIDPLNNYYSVGIMKAAPIGPGTTLYVPFAQVLQPPPGGHPSTFYPFPMTGVQGLDPYTLQYYWAANVVFSTPSGPIPVWSRVFLPPQPGPLSGFPDGSPPGINVANVPLSGGGFTSVSYHHVLLPGSVPPPAEFYLQQPH